MSALPAVPRRLEAPRRPRLPRIGAIDAAGLEARAGALAARSIAGEARLRALELAVRLVDLTALEPDATPRSAAALCAKAVRPDAGDAAVPSVAAVCVRPGLVGVCRERLEGSGVRVAAVLPPGPGAAAGAAACGADEVELAIDHAAFLTGRYAAVADGIARAKEAIGEVPLTVALEPGALGGYGDLRRASLLAILAGADFVAAPAGDGSPGSTLPAALCILEAIRDARDESGRVAGFKSADGLRTAEQAIRLLVLVHETLGSDWLAPGRCRIGASGLLNELLMELREQRTGIPQGRDYFSVA